MLSILVKCYFSKKVSVRRAGSERLKGLTYRECINWRLIESKM